MPVYKSKSATKDGRCWFHKTQYFLPGDTEQKIFVSKKFATKAEAILSEQQFIINAANKKEVSTDMTFKELIDKFLEYKKDKVKFTTYEGYLSDIKYLECFYPVKCFEYNINQYEAWKKKLNSNSILSTRTKNDLLKFWKSILNFGMTWYNFDFIPVYRRMSNFTNPCERKKEMMFYTLEEFNKFISNETDLKYICLFETLFYCGLRHGELRGLQWCNIDFEKKILSVTKQVIRGPKNSNERFVITNPKTKTSNRVIPICELLLSNLLNYKKQLENLNLYDPSYYIFGNKTTPFNSKDIYNKRSELAKLANIKQIRIHDFRHSCASLLINNGGNVTMVAKYLGHSELEETLNTYSHMFPSALDNVLNIINELK